MPQLEQFNLTLPIHVYLADRFIVMEPKAGWLSLIHLVTVKMHILDLKDLLARSKRSFKAHCSLSFIVNGCSFGFPPSAPEWDRGAEL